MACVILFVISAFILVYDLAFILVYDLALIWNLFGILCGFILWKLHEINVSVQLWLSMCERDIFLVRDREEDTETDSYVFFFRDFNVTTPQRRSSQH